MSEREDARQLMRDIARRGLRFADPVPIAPMPSLNEHTLILKALQRLADEKPPKAPSRLRIWPW